MKLTVSIDKIIHGLGHCHAVPVDVHPLANTRSVSPSCTEIHIETSFLKGCELVKRTAASLSRG